MANRIEVAPGLDAGALELRCRQASDAVERSHWQIVWLAAKGLSRRAVAEVTGYSERWIRAVIGRYNAHGPEGLGDGRHGNPGAKPLLDEVQRRELLAALAEPPLDGGLWNSRKVAAWIAATTEHKEVHAQRGWEYLRRLGFTLKRPRPRHAKASAEDQAAFKKEAGRAACRAPGRARPGRLRALGDG
jgi:transposase